MITHHNLLEPVFIVSILQNVLDVLGVPESFPDGNPQRAIYCSRTLNLRSIKAIGGGERFLGGGDKGLSWQTGDPASTVARHHHVCAASPLPHTSPPHCASTKQSLTLVLQPPFTATHQAVPVLQAASALCCLACPMHPRHHNLCRCAADVPLLLCRAGYDMDYTLIHYDVNAWEGRAYEYGLDSLRQQVGRLCHVTLHTCTPPRPSFSCVWLHLLSGQCCQMGAHALGHSTSQSMLLQARTKEVRLPVCVSAPGCITTCLSPKTQTIMSARRPCLTCVCCCWCCVCPVCGAGYPCGGPQV